MPDYPLLKKGLTTGWLQRFFNEPFDPICVMLAMRTKLLLDIIDEMGHSYNLLRAIGFGWIDWGEIPSELPGEPGDYYPPEIDNPIIVTPQPGAPGPGEPGYIPQAAAPAIPLPIGGRPSGGNLSGSMAAPWGLMDQGLWQGKVGGTTGGGGGINCCANIDIPGELVKIGYDSLALNCGETLTLRVTGYNPVCDGEFYNWVLNTVGGSLDPLFGYETVYTPPTCDEECDPSPEIALYCEYTFADVVHLAINSCPAAAHIVYTDQQMGIDEDQPLSAAVDTPGCGTPVFTWAIVDGGGELSETEGPATVYTSPHTNEECENNPTIELRCNGNVLDTLEIAVNAYPDPYEAYYISNITGALCAWAVRKTAYQCDGSWLAGPTDCGACDQSAQDPCFHCCMNKYYCEGQACDGGNWCESTSGAYCTEAGALAQCTPENWCGSAHGKTIGCTGASDVRAAGAITGGCCPAALL